VGFNPSGVAVGAAPSHLTSSNSFTTHLRELTPERIRRPLLSTLTLTSHITLSFKITHLTSSYFTFISLLSPAITMADNIGPMPELNPLQRAFNLFLVGLGPNQLEEILEFIRHNQGNHVYYAQNDFIRQTEDVVTAMNENIPNAPQVPAGNGRGARAKGQGDRKLRPLNSFIAFRSKLKPLNTFAISQC
jgi:hypothetical protein